MLRLIIPLICTFVVLISSTVESLPKLVRIGGLFRADEEEQELAFRFAIERINTDTSLLPKTTLIAQIERVDKADSFHTHKKVCGLLRNGVLAIFGPQSGITSMQVQSICETFEIPHIENRLDFESLRTDLSINFYPRPSLLSKVYMDLIKSWGWRSFAIIYEENAGVVHYKDFFKKSKLENWDIKWFQLKPNIPYRDILRGVKDTNCLNIILNVRHENIQEVMKHALQVGILTEFHNYLIANLDLHALNIDHFKHSKTNLTSLRIVDQNNFQLKSLLNEWPVYASRLGRRNFMSPPIYIKTETALIYDGIVLLVKALKDLDGNHLDIKPISCDSGDPWLHGSSLINYMRQISFTGITGLVKFDDSGFRSDISLEILSHTEDGFDIAGKWTEGKLQKFDLWKNHYLITSFENEFIRITTAFNDPFIMQKNSTEALKGNDRYEGYVVDLIDELAKDLNFRYQIEIVKDGAYGSYNNDTKQWNGMIGEVIRGEADIAAADLTINSDREKAIDFTYPFMATGITILYKKPVNKETSLWSFMLPFSDVLWFYLLGALVLVGIVLSFVGRYSPYEWANTYPCRERNQVLQNVYDTSNSFWYGLGGIMQQGSDVAPSALSTRVIGGIWAFFTLIIISSYTANLAAFLTVEIATFPFENVEGLAAQNKVKYGCVQNAATHKFFKSSKIPTYKKMAQFMDKNPEVFKTKNALGRDGVEKADGKYAFFMESANVEYIIERFCNLTQIGGLLDNKGYGIATKKGSKYRTPISQSILKLQETGVLRKMKDKWWKQKGGGGQCLAQPTSSLLELGLRNVGGVFVILIAGCVLAFFLAICEFVFKVYKQNKNKGTFGEEIINNVKFIFLCSTSTKPIKLKDKSLTTSKSFVGSKTDSLEPHFTTFF